MTTALVLGGASCLWDDVDAALKLGEFDLVVACNDAGAAWPGPLNAWVSLHPEKFDTWIERRRRAGHEPSPAILSHLAARPHRKPLPCTGTTDHKFPGQITTGSSGLFALKVALVDLGADRAVLSGVPMDAGQGHFFAAAQWRAARSHQGGWHEALPQIRHRARSMSGWTADLLGRPDAGWLGA